MEVRSGAARVMPPTRGLGRSLVFTGQGFAFAAIVGVMAFAGNKADVWLETEPWLMATGTLVGVGLAIYDLIRTVEAWEKRQSKDE